MDAVPKAAVSVGATLPAVLGACVHEVALGFAGSFGAHLVAATHPKAPS